MISIQSAMLVALGFLSACLVILLFAPAFWARAVRLTTRRLKQTLPLSEIEIRAERDRIRAEYAMKLHKLETELEHGKHAAARQSIDINRRDAIINASERELDALKAKHEEALNARRVLEQTVADRLPRVEQRLNEAKDLLHSRDEEIAALTREAGRHAQALAAAEALNTQLRAETKRLQAALDARSVRSQPGGAVAANAEIELSLRSEVEALRARAKAQSQLIARLRKGGEVEGIGQDRAASRAEGEPMPLQSGEALADVERRLRAAVSRSEDQAGEIARLKAALAVFESQAATDAGAEISESKISLKARQQALEAQSAEQSGTIEKLRSELAGANEKLASQAEYYMAELRRLGSGSVQASGRPRRASRVARQAEPAERADAPHAGQETRATVIPLNSAASTAAIAEAPPAAADEGASARMTGEDAARAGAADEARPANRARPRLLERIASLNRSN
ncbi:MAG: hypothetical protein R3D68_15605 [Hyphomicrobiaceae bacterium]